MSSASLADLRNLNVLVLHPTDPEGEFLVDHLRRIGCSASQDWPVPNRPPPDVDVVFLAIEDNAGATVQVIPHVTDEIKQFVTNLRKPSPTILAIVSYENPTALQMVLESGALAVIERPIKPFGLLTNLAIARNSWLVQQGMQRDIRKYKRKVMGDRQVARAKVILMAMNGTTESDAHNEIRQMAMAQQMSMEEVAESIIGAEGDLRKVLNRG